MQYELAEFGQRFFAIFIDGVILAIVGGILGGILGSTATGSFGSFVIGVAYYWYFWTRNNGQSPGKSAMNIRIIKVDGTPLTDADAIIRYIGYYVSGFFFLLGFIWASFDSESQAWHDKIAKTYVVRAD